MTRAQFIERWKHRNAGRILDAIKARDGPALSLFLTTIFERIESDLGIMWDDLQPKEPIKEEPKNGTPVGTRPVVPVAPRKVN